MTKAKMRASRKWWRARERFWYRKLAAAKTMRDRRLYRAKAETARLRVRQYDAALRAPTVASPRGIKFLEAREGLVDHLYLDTRGFCTGGVGHLVRQGRCTTADHTRYDSFTESDWLALFARDLVPYEKAVAGVFDGAKLTANEQMFDACVSLAFNVGIRGFQGSTVAREVRAGNKQAAAEAFLLWDRPPELLPRRKLERSLFLS